MQDDRSFYITGTREGQNKTDNYLQFLKENRFTVLFLLLFSYICILILPNRNIVKGNFDATSFDVRKKIVFVKLEIKFNNVPFNGSLWYA